MTAAIGSFYHEQSAAQPADGIRLRPYLHAVSYLFPRDDIPPEIVRSIMLYCLDCFDEDGTSGKCGTSCMAMMFLSNWINGYGQTGHLPISSKYLSG